MYFRATGDQYEYLSRLAAAEGHSSIQRVIEERLFKKTMNRDLETLRAQHRKLGYRDSLFFAMRKRKQLGLKLPVGRRPKLLTLATA